MWKCTICNKENQDSVLICSCGFDRSRDYENFRTFVKLGRKDFRNFQNMQSTVRNDIKFENEKQKDVITIEPKEEQEDLVENKPKEDQEDLAATEQKEKQDNLLENKQGEKGETIPTDTDTVLLKKTIFPKTKLDWLTLGMGIVLLCGFLYGDSWPILHYFTGYSFSELIGDIIMSLPDGFFLYFIVIICYLVMRKSLRAIQYDRKKKIILYAISSILPLCYFGDIVWGYIIFSSSRELQGYFVEHREIISASWYILYIGLLLFAWKENPKKIIAKKMARKEKRQNG